MKAREVLDLIEAPQYRTKIGEVETEGGSRHIRNMVEKATKKVEQMLDPEHPSPCPCDDEDEAILNEVCGKLHECAIGLKAVKETRRRK